MQFRIRIHLYSKVKLFCYSFNFFRSKIAVSLNLYYTYSNLRNGMKRKPQAQQSSCQLLFMSLVSYLKLSQLGSRNELRLPPPPSLPCSCFPLYSLLPFLFLFFSLLSFLPIFSSLLPSLSPFLSPLSLFTPLLSSRSFSKFTILQPLQTLIHCFIYSYAMKLINGEPRISNTTCDLKILEFRSFDVCTGLFIEIVTLFLVYS